MRFCSFVMDKKSAFALMCVNDGPALSYSF